MKIANTVNRFKVKPTDRLDKVAKSIQETKSIFSFCLDKYCCKLKNLNPFSNIVCRCNFGKLL